MNQQFEVVNVLKYTTVENAPKYRAIMRFLYEQSEKFQHYSKIEEILEHLKERNQIDEHYTQEKLYDDLKVLENWECVISKEDKTVVRTIEEFKKKRLEFQITNLAKEFESILKKLDELDDVLTGSLESKEFERILKGIIELKAVDVTKDSNDVIYEKWINLIRIIENLRRNSSNYLSHLKSEQAENLFKTEEFVLYKDKFTDYLTKFVFSMKRNRHKIAKELRNMREDFIETYIERLVEYFSLIPTVDGKKFDVERTKRIHQEKWLELKSWFVKSKDEKTEVERLLEETEKSIQVLSRYALRLSEIKNNNQNRKEDYRTLATMFYQSNSLEEAHRLSACVFGVPHTRHIFGKEKQTESSNENLWEQMPVQIETTPKNRTYERSKKMKSRVKMDKEKEQRRIREIVEKREKQQKEIENLIVNNRLVLRDLPVIQPYVRKTLLHWITKAVQNKSRAGKTESGRSYIVKMEDNQKIALRCEDGVLTMPNIIFEFGG